MNQVENVIHLGSNQLGFVADSHCNNGSIPSIHDSLAERDDVVLKLKRCLWTSCHSCCLVQNLGYNRQVGLEMATNGLSNVSKALQNGWLELITKGLTL